MLEIRLITLRTAMQKAKANNPAIPNVSNADPPPNLLALPELGSCAALHTKNSVLPVVTSEVSGPSTYPPQQCRLALSSQSDFLEYPSQAEPTMAPLVAVRRQRHSPFLSS